jgi:hypothetical protein
MRMRIAAERVRHAETVSSRVRQRVRVDGSLHPRCWPPRRSSVDPHAAVEKFAFRPSVVHPCRTTRIVRSCSIRSADQRSVRVERSGAESSRVESSRVASTTSGRVIKPHTQCRKGCGRRSTREWSGISSGAAHTHASVGNRRPAGPTVPGGCRVRARASSSSFVFVRRRHRAIGFE